MEDLIGHLSAVHGDDLQRWHADHHRSTVRWAGTEPIEPEAHPDCECLRCCGCQVPGCLSTDVDGYMVATSTAFLFRARVLLCLKHSAGAPKG